MDPSSSVEDAVLESILRLSLEEAEEREERLHGKSRVGAPQTTEQYALQLQAAELETALQSVRDARLARNIADAVDDDDVQQLVHLEHAQRENRDDRAEAEAMASMGSTPGFDEDVPMAESPERLAPDLFPEHEMYARD
jgi:hypothetical protein